MMDLHSEKADVMKATPQDAALLGGKPLFDHPLHVGRPNLGSREKLYARFDDMFERRWLTNDGPYVKELEQRFAQMLGVKHCILTTNATIGLEIAIRAADLKGEVIIPSFTFVATAHALQWQEITPVFCDVAPSTHNIDPNRIEDLITPRTSGIIGVHVWGVGCDVAALQEIATRRHLTLMFDAAHALFCTHGGQWIGGFGDAEIFSFHATKFFNTFEGGAITTNNDALAKRIRSMRNFGFSAYDYVDSVGTNGKMTEVSAAMGLVMLDEVEHIVATNQENYEYYQQGLAGIAGIQMFPYAETERNNYHYIIVEVDETITGIHRDLLVKLLHAENILARRYFFPGCHQMEPYRSYFPHAKLLLTETERLTQRVMSLPNGTAVGKAEIAEICAFVRWCVNHAEAIQSAMKVNEA